MAEHGQGDERARPLVVAHRGAWGEAPQNSRAAFERAIELGCDAIELDVRRTADARLAVVHDARVAGRAVARLTHAELRARLRDGQAPLLEEVVELACGRIALDVELKDEDSAGTAIAILRRRLEPGQYVVTSFRESALAAVARTCPEARTGLLVGPRLRRRELDGRVRRARAGFLAPHVTLARRGILAWAAQRGLAAWVWTVNDPRTLRRLGADPRVAALITDRPQRALDIVDGRE